MEAGTLLPSTTQRPGTHFTFGPVATAHVQFFLFVVARLPSRMPARARSVEPVQTETMYLRLG
jgi:hypothetical protein